MHAHLSELGAAPDVPDEATQDLDVEVVPDTEWKTQTHVSAPAHERSSGRCHIHARTRKHSPVNILGILLHEIEQNFVVLAQVVHSVHHIIGVSCIFEGQGVGEQPASARDKLYAIGMQVVVRASNQSLPLELGAVAAGEGRGVRVPQRGIRLGHEQLLHGLEVVEAANTVAHGRGACVSL